MNTRGRLDIQFGSMCSGKTESLLRKMTRPACLGLKAVYINHTLDTRAEKFSTHSPLFQGQNLPIISVKVGELRSPISPSDETGFKSWNWLKNYHIVGIDEAQFFGEDLVDFVKYLVDTLKLYVIVVGLDGTFERKKFGYITDLIPLADNVVKLHAICKYCAQSTGNDNTNDLSAGNAGELRSAIFTLRTTSSKDTILVGGHADYSPVCRECYLRETLGELHSPTTP